MRKRYSVLGLAAALFAGGSAQAGVDLSGLSKDIVGPKTQVLVLGSVHLSQMPKGFKPESLNPLLDRLVAYKPDVITIEAISGEGCDRMKRYTSLYSADDVKHYCRDTSAAKVATGLDMPAAIGEVDKTLKAWPAKPTAAQRRHLAALFLAAGDDASAVVQWLQLPAAERIAGDGLDETLAATLRKLETKNNEDYLIAARVAARLGLQRVYPADDHTGDNLPIDDEQAYGKAIQQAWNGAAGLTKTLGEKEDALSKGGDMLALYRLVNKPDSLSLRAQSDFAAALRDPSPQHYGQLYVAGWETRNLRMVSNVRAAFGDRPGARVLAIVGAMHKPWFDNFLGQMQVVEIVDAEQILK
ncbi:MAG: hypothetical protein J0I77_12885 [Rudaea sp.]|uniref:DUF5694 domain-containing protein n=1 Tax=unclassified Rudaea TaxID=2627037 RepID=UPI0010F511B5|nr:MULTISPECIES: DUF5694 domain-containing protein [unclassified Rudaea]MBN8886611.1 hypothetical protein [Rudaea sp.]MBR0345883.1 hypothetical protein [Rudaea sp.]